MTDQRTINDSEHTTRTAPASGDRYQVVPVVRNDHGAPTTSKVEFSAGSTMYQAGRVVGQDIVVTVNGQELKAREARQRIRQLLED